MTNSKPLRISDMRVRVLSQRVELLAIEIAAIAGTEEDLDKVDTIIEKLMNITRPLRNPAGIDRDTFDVLRKHIQELNIADILHTAGI